MAAKHHYVPQFYIKLFKMPEALEKTFSEIVDKAKPVIDSLIVDQTKQLSEKEKANFIYYIAHQGPEIRPTARP